MKEDNNNMTNENNEIRNPFYDLSQSITSSKSYARFIKHILKQNKDMVEKNVVSLNSNQCKAQQGITQDKLDNREPVSHSWTSPSLDADGSLNMNNRNTNDRSRYSLCSPPCEYGEIYVPDEFEQVSAVDLSLYPAPPKLSAVEGPLNQEDIRKCMEYLGEMYKERDVKTVYGLYDLMRGRLHYDYITFILCYMCEVNYKELGYEVTEETKNMFDRCGISLG
jgi:hypothetical protein